METKILKSSGWVTTKESETILTPKIRECIKNSNSPYPEEVFYALKGLKPSQVKVVIIGKDPYPEPTKSHGLALSIRNNDEVITDTLKNTFQEILRQYPKAKFETNNLTSWKEQGVLLLNASLTYIKGMPYNEAAEIWAPFLNHIVKKIIKKRLALKKTVVFILLGGYANTVGAFAQDENDNIFKAKNIYILRASHPNKRSKNYSGNYKKLAKNVRAFTGCRFFKECNKILKRHDEAQVDWGTKII